ncbi:DEAD/DEAH box helicase [Pseudoalteromonas sp. MMG005]|uniref:DEAD/DEAH box helicase n=1 Tax=Pseudoalteromonas sp. MMG005 TaxID=2822682 RepID=UPI001B3A32ED|nr:DEAD/DEAH box helicase [Pseudoalteromonas sp. MMG005]MBQ4845630.1 DEAD/DEAH box helicase [Pseudoalteromonas sp. MMG005]
MKITALLPQEIDACYHQFLSRSHAEQWVFTVMAVIYKPISLGNLNKLLKQLDKQAFNSKHYAYERITSNAIKAWQQLGFIRVHNDELKLTHLLTHQLTHKAITRDVFFTILKAGETVVPVIQLYDWEQTLDDEQRLIRDFYFLNDHNKMVQHLKIHKNPQQIDYQRGQILIELNFVPFQLTHFVTLPDTLQYQSFACWFYVLRQRGASNAYALTLLEQVHDTNNSERSLSLLLAEQYLLQGKINKVRLLMVPNDNSCYSLQLKATLALLAGDIDSALNLFSKALTAKNKYGKKKFQHLDGLYSLFYQLTLLIAANKLDATYFSLAEKHVHAQSHDKNSQDHSHHVGQFMLPLIESLSTATPYTSLLPDFTFLHSHHVFYAHLIHYFDALAVKWCQPLSNEQQLSSQALHHAYLFFEATDYRLFSLLIEQLTPHFNVNNSVDVELPSTHNLFDLTQAISHKVSWDLALDKLISLAPEDTSANTHLPDTASRLIWEITIAPFCISLSARAQKKTTSGWSKGRPVSLQRLYEQSHEFTFMSEQDIKICSHINRAKQWQDKTHYTLEGARALTAACGAPNLFLVDDVFTPIELNKAQPELLITQQNNHLVLSIAEIPATLNGIPLNYSLTEYAPEQYRLTVFAPEHLKVAQIIGEEGLTIPISAKEKVLESVSAIAPLLNIQSSIAELDTGLETHPADARLVINIQPFHDGLEFTCFVMPFGEQGPTFKPGIGNAKITTELNGKRVATSRNLIQEEQYLDILDTHCPAFLTMQDNRLQLNDLQTALETLQQLDHTTALDPSPIPLTLRWPKGKTMTLTKPLHSHHLQLALSKKHQWFDLSGHLVVDDSHVIELKRLLSLTSQAHGRFIELDNHQILALSDELKQRLDQLNTATDNGQFHPLASLHVSQATTGMRMKTLHAWDEQHVKMTQANLLECKVPTTLRATLRDYQIEGFDWASRLAHWGAGACLADDMGLGKTLQALALLVSRAHLGPSLVIAPTSVCFNWQQEATKFAPTLNIKLLSDIKTSAKRADALKQLNSLDCLIISYGLLQRESALLQACTWSTIVADEAQALKNPLAQRSIAACTLKGDFKLITTGTPIENNLTELWSLFRFVNPGLLGNLKRFSARFSTPIDNVKDDPIAAKKARSQLKNLIQPFILRRMKDQVLTELPARTDINVKVQLSEEEMALYEALRLTAIENLTATSQQDQAGAQRIKMLAELTKLRQACCHPSLVLSDNTLPSAKLIALDKLLNELQENNHKALIFSQFVGHLQLIKQHLDSKGVDYQYLDGSTPQRDRQHRVNAFQQGEGQVFLISLKAGGSGLNLTAADYVIHMDPWWNPAVEEQASDRAHRMGQLRPVTVYRLIAINTIEEKIVALHQHKRDLAQTLLSGSDSVSKLSVTDIIAMLKKTF